MVKFNYTEQLPLVYAFMTIWVAWCVTSVVVVKLHGSDVDHLWNCPQNGWVWRVYVGVWLWFPYVPQTMRPKKTMDITQEYHRFAVFDPPNMDSWMIRVTVVNEDFAWDPRLSKLYINSGGHCCWQGATLKPYVFSYGGIE